MFDASNEIPTTATVNRRSSTEESQFEEQLRASVPNEGSSLRAIEQIETSKQKSNLGRKITSDTLSVLQTPIFFNSVDFIQTASGNKVAVKSVLCGSHKIHMIGKVGIEERLIIKY